jgi:hypothetical protein
MKKTMLFLIGTVGCLWLTGCAVPGPYYGTYTGVNYHGPGHAVHTAVARGASVVERVFHHGRYYHPRLNTYRMPAPYIYRPPVVYPLRRHYIYR